MTEKKWHSYERFQWRDQLEKRLYNECSVEQTVLEGPSHR